MDDKKILEMQKMSKQYTREEMLKYNEESKPIFKPVGGIVEDDEEYEECYKENHCSNRWHHRKQPQVNAPEERSMFYNKQHNELFKRRFSFDLNDSYESIENLETTSKKVKVKK